MLCVLVDNLKKAQALVAYEPGGLLHHLLPLDQLRPNNPSDARGVGACSPNRSLLRSPLNHTIRLRATPSHYHTSPNRTIHSQQLPPAHLHTYLTRHAMSNAHTHSTVTRHHPQQHTTFLTALPPPFPCQSPHPAQAKPNSSSLCPPTPHVRLPHDPLAHSPLPNPTP